MVDEPEMAFIPDEPFEDLDTPSFDAPAALEPTPSYSSSGPDPVDELLPMTAEESESLSGSGDASATVMFRADSLPWTAAPAAPAPVLAAPSPMSTPAEIVPDLPVFEEVIEETEVETELPVPVMTSPPLVETPSPMPLPPAVVAAPVVPPPASAPLPPPVVAVAPPPPPAPVAPVFAAPVFTPAPELRPVPAPPEPLEASSFADVAAEIREPEAPTTPSLAAQVDVPVDMVSQIAQRVVAQVSEKVVERIAWEVIPELAEALIKREIERLKAEIQQL